MLVSVIIPMHNAENTIERLYTSLYRSNYKDLEIIFVDNASTDRSYEKVSYYQMIDPRVKVVKEEKLGVTYARRHGFQEATGEYVYFVDADDYVTPNGIADMAWAAEMENADIVRGHFYSLYDEDIKHALEICSMPLGFFGRQFDGPSKQSFQSQNIPMWCALYKKTLIKDHYFVNLQQGEDHLFNLYAYADAKIVVDIPTYVYIYIRHQNGLSMTSNLTDAYRLLNEYGKIAVNYAEKGILESHQIQLEKRIIQNYLMLYSVEYRTALRNLFDVYALGINQKRMQDIYEILKAFKPYSNPLIREDVSDCEMLMLTNIPCETEYQEVREKQLTLK